LPAANRFPYEHLFAPVTRGVAVTPSDTADLPFVPRTIWVGGAGNLAIVNSDGTTVTLQNLYVGWHDIRTTRILANGTTATLIVAWD
jgi:hypothetical protein